MTVEELIEELQKVEDKGRLIVIAESGNFSLLDDDVHVNTDFYVEKVIIW